MKTPFISREDLETIVAEFPTPFHLYDEKGIREKARAVNQAFSWNKGFKEYFAVKATPTPAILKILQEEGCGVDCSSYVELLMSHKLDFPGSEIMFSSNNTPDKEYAYARELGATINLDDFEDIEHLERAAGIPEIISCRYNPRLSPIVLRVYSWMPLQTLRIIRKGTPAEHKRLDYNQRRGEEIGLKYNLYNHLDYFE